MLILLFTCICQIPGVNWNGTLCMNESNLSLVIDEENSNKQQPFRTNVKMTAVQNVKTCLFSANCSFLFSTVGCRAVRSCSRLRLTSDPRLLNSPFRPVIFVQEQWAPPGCGRRRPAARCGTSGHSWLTRLLPVFVLQLTRRRGSWPCASCTTSAWTTDSSPCLLTPTAYRR